MKTTDFLPFVDKFILLSVNSYWKLRIWRDSSISFYNFSRKIAKKQPFLVAFLIYVCSIFL